MRWRVKAVGTMLSLTTAFAVVTLMTAGPASADGASGFTEARALMIAQSTAGSDDRTFGWSITKHADPTIVKQVGGSATFYYTVAVSHDGGTISNVQVTGSIQVIDPNNDSNGVTLPVQIDGVTDHLSDGTTCSVPDGGAQTVTAFSTFLAYGCDLQGQPQGDLDNSAFVTWPEQLLGDGSHLAAGSDSSTFNSISFTDNPVDRCVDVTDSVVGSLGSACIGGANPRSFTYPRTIAIPRYGCQSYGNHATFTTDDTGTTGSATATVTVCGPTETGAVSIGFWRNKNGQKIITRGASAGGVCDSGTWLRQYAPFQDLSATASCSQVAAYASNILNATNGGGATVETMLKGQMLASALDVYFSDPALGGNELGTPRPIGAVAIDLTRVCADPSCGAYENVGGAFGGAAGLTVSQIVAYAAGQSNVGGSTWYGNVGSTEELAKLTFGAINDQRVFAP
jgi:hypothetical protein